MKIHRARLGCNANGWTSAAEISVLPAGGNGDCRSDGGATAVVKLTIFGFVDLQ
jgi:hypothetical protein